MTGAVDVHAHHFPSEYLAVARGLERETDTLPETVARAVHRTVHHPLMAETGRLRDLRERLALMDGAGVATQVLSFSAPHIHHPDPVRRLRLARAWNDGCASACVGYPDRFAFFATLPLPFVPEALDELHRVAELPGFAGIGLPTHPAGCPIDDPRWLPLLAAADALGTSVFLHPDGFCAPGVLDDYYMDWSIGAPFEDTIAAVRLAASGRLAEHPSVRWIVPHLGGTLPFLAARLDRLWLGQRSLMRGEEPPSSAYQRLYFDTANSSVDALAFTAKVFGADRLVFGTDYPYVDGRDLHRPLLELRAAGVAQASDAGARLCRRRDRHHHQGVSHD